MPISLAIALAAVTFIFGFCIGLALDDYLHRIPYEGDLWKDKRDDA